MSNLNKNKLDSKPKFNKNLRKNFGNIETFIDIPNLISLQKTSYENTFLQINTNGTDRSPMGLQTVLESCFPITDKSERISLEFVKYDIEKPKYNVEECKRRGISYTSSLRITLRLIIQEIDESTKAKEVIEIKEQQIYLADIPLMTNGGTFIINGAERVVVSQMHRSPGVFFDHDKGKNNLSGKFLYSASVIPYRGSWLDFEFDTKDQIYFRIDRKRKLPATCLLKAIGMNNQEILDFFYKKVYYHKSGADWYTDFSDENVSIYKLEEDLVDFDTSEIVLKAGEKLTPRLVKKFSKSGLKRIKVNPYSLIGKYIADTIYTPDKKDIILKCGEEIKESMLSILLKNNFSEISLLKIDNSCGPYIRNTLMNDKTPSKEMALYDIFKVASPGEMSSSDASKVFFQNLFFEKSKYDLSEVGRVKMNGRLNIDEPIKNTILTNDDIKNILKVLVEIKDGNGFIDDIDHLINRRVRTVGELVENQFRIGMVRIYKAAIERMSSVNIDSVMPYDLINTKMLISVLREFFGISQLSQFMDQTNPLSEITHKRRISALGPGGLNRERAVFEVRDVHPTHYGRICPIETPEGQNIGLISSMATYSRINCYGFLESPYNKVENGKITGEVIYLSAIDEAKYKIAQSNIKKDKNYLIIEDIVQCRYNGDFVIVPPSEVDFTDVAPMQVVSVAASLIPFLENDDANRALMGSNMQRQAVPLIKSESPFVGTGMEAIVAKDSMVCVMAEEDGIVSLVDSTKIIVKRNDDSSKLIDVYNLLKYQKSNYNTCINQSPVVSIGQKVKAGDIIAEGQSIHNGEIALGKNVLVAFVPWYGFNFEDSILISERIAKNDIYTSVHIEEFECVARDTRLGAEEITRDIPNSNEELLKHLDETGIVRIGSEVKSGYVLVGRVTPKTESQATPEEKLLKSIFGEKASEVKDTSLHLPPSVNGTVIGVRIFCRRGIEKDERTLSLESKRINQLARDKDDQLKILEAFTYAKLREILIGKDALGLDQLISSNATKTGSKTSTKSSSADKGGKITESILDSIQQNLWWKILVEDQNIMNEVNRIKDYYEIHKNEILAEFNDAVEKIKVGDDLSQGALKVVKVYVATKHKLQPGDKMSGRHGNKGVISKIVPEEDMPFLEDGTQVDVVLNPLGVPSRMNIGQILETHLGWAAFNLGKKIGELLDNYNAKKGSYAELVAFVKKIYEKDDLCKAMDSMKEEEFLSVCSILRKGIRFATPVFDGAKIDDIKRMLELSGQDKSGQVKLRDGRTGEFFDRYVTVGYNYLLKLHHLVEDKMHTRSIGSYSLVTQQPLGGKSHFGGQRFGEMECWALQAYGAAYTLQEMLTVKSDDVFGRIKAYESIINGENSLECGIPESFNVMVKELRSLCLNIDLRSDSASEEEKHDNLE